MNKLNLAINNDHLFVFESTLPVMASHLHYGQHLSHESLLSLLQDARMQLLAQEGMAEMAIEGAIGFLISQVSVDYKSQSFHGDELRIQIYAQRFTPRARVFSLQYQVIRDSDKMIIAQAATRHAFYNFARKQVTRAPKAFYWMIHRNLQLLTQAA